MASKAASMLRPPRLQLGKTVAALPRRTFASSSSFRPVAVRSSIPGGKLSQPFLKQSFRRSYADATLTPPPKRRAGFFRWTLRLFYLTSIGALAWVGYEVYQLRTPDEQVAQDPEKKTLVILGSF